MPSLRSATDCDEASGLNLLTIDAISLNEQHPVEDTRRTFSAASRIRGEGTRCMPSRFTTLLKAAGGSTTASIRAPIELVLVGDGSAHVVTFASPSELLSTRSTQCYSRFTQ